MKRLAECNRKKSEASKKRKEEAVRKKQDDIARTREELEELGHGFDRQSNSDIDGDWRTRRIRFIEEHLRIRNKAGALVPLVANEAQRSFELRAGQRNIVLKARQLGMTTWVAARFFAATITRPGTLSVQVAHDKSSAEAIFRIVHRFLENLPERWRKGALRTSRANVGLIRFPAIDSEYRVETAADMNAGRGLTIQNLHCSEVARWPREAAETLASLRAAVVPDGEVVIESTPFGAGGCFYDEWQRAEETGYVRHFLPWWIDRAYELEVASPENLVETFTEQELALAEKHGLSPGQIAFRREIERQFQMRAPQEYAEDAESCFLASGECVFDSAKIEQQLKTCPAPYAKEEHGMLWTWLNAVPGKVGKKSRYVIGVDPAGGGPQGDYACAQVVDRTTGMQCAELHGHLTPKELSNALVRLGERYYGAELAVERNNHGHAVLALLERSKYQNVYCQNGERGWLTHTASRPAMISYFMALMDERPELFKSERLLRECRTFVRRADGDAQAAAGAHDDSIMAMAIAVKVAAEF